jgi:hypothetical protein
MTLPDVTMRTFNLYGVEHREQMVPHMWVVVDTFHPHITPWDCTGGRHQRVLQAILREADIESLALVTHKRRLSPMGSGPGGRVRFGDDMLPGVYRTAVAKRDFQAAEKALATHREAVTQWLDQQGYL